MQDYTAQLNEQLQTIKRSNINEVGLLMFSQDILMMEKETGSTIIPRNAILDLTASQEAV